MILFQVKLAHFRGQMFVLDRPLHTFVHLNFENRKASTFGDMKMFIQGKHIVNDMTNKK